MKSNLNIKKLAALSSLILILFTPTVFALEPAKGDILLKITGQISEFNSDKSEANFDLDLLRSYPVTTIRTDTPWTDGVIVFEGVLLRDLLASVKSSGQELIATALNDYSVTIPIEDIVQNDVIVAYKQNGKLMSIRDKGPLWIIYPWRDKPKLKSELNLARSIWQIDSIHVDK